MKYFKLTNKQDPEDEFYTSSTSNGTTPEDLCRILNLDDYHIVEVTEEEFERETGESYEDGEESDPKAEALKLLDLLKDDIAARYEEETFFDPEAQQNFMDGLMTKLFEITRKVEAI